MKKILIIVVLICCFQFVFSQENTITNLGTFDIVPMQSSMFVLKLEYEIPEEITEVYIYPTSVLRINSLIVDGMIIEPRNNIYSDVYGSDLINHRTIDDNEKNVQIYITWEFYKYLNGARFLSFPRFAGENPVDYIIPNGSNTVIMEYTILFPNGKETNPDKVEWTVQWVDKKY